MSTKEENEAAARAVIEQLVEDPGAGCYPAAMYVDTAPQRRPEYEQTRCQIAIGWAVEPTATLPIGEWIRLAFQIGLKAGAGE